VLSAVVKPKFSAMQEHCHTKLLATLHSLFATRYSPFATRCCFNIRQSLFAAVLFPTCRFADFTICRQLGSAGASPSHFLPSRKVIHQSPIAIRVLYSPFAAVSTAGGQSRLPFATRCSPLAIRHSLLATRLPKNFRLQAKARIM